METRTLFRGLLLGLPPACIPGRAFGISFLGGVMPFDEKRTNETQAG
jgi:hypothetical protein